ncbi:hypothetical protein HMI01_17940 [Halolactibacillus miurensis]|uniref:Peptidase propeptide and YPEB domain-containing protein n=1 Tax=Halolactibacillus miurensis TaxID=306541 RepID=A0A1I6TWZ3_9BACI|nr:MULTISPECIES: hypothetical protein [Halolactibacillus]GEM04806.1 hypothetical protein HMI01_17940 [Halolactibacillus miurensis]SFS93690.1 hypothetical protein SAMN05421668_1192 [Halolactibacillus miurensis]
MKKSVYIILAFGLILTACRNEDTEPVDDSDINQQDEDNGTDTTENNQENDDATEADDETDEDPEASDESANNGDQTAEDTHPDDTTDDTESSHETDNSESGGRYSSDDAIRLVKDYLKAEGLYMDMTYLYDGKDDNGHYRIQVFEVVDHGNGETHTSTFDWYFVDPETGDITALFNS